MAVLSERERSELVRAARTATGDELRSLAYFDDEAVEQRYLRDDLDRSADLVGFAETDRRGFRSRMMYANSQLGEQRFTIRAFANGYLTRVIDGEHGVWVATDPMRIDRFEELASALSGTLGSFSA